MLSELCGVLIFA